VPSIDGTALAPTLETGVGTPAGTGCAISGARYVAPELLAQLVITSPKGVHCVRVADTGEL